VVLQLMFMMIMLHLHLPRLARAHLLLFLLHVGIELRLLVVLLHVMVLVGDQLPPLVLVGGVATGCVIAHVVVAIASGGSRTVAAAGARGHIAAVGGVTASGAFACVGVGQ
jgi:hypothetical protein